MRVWIDADACPRLARDQVIKFGVMVKSGVRASGGFPV